MTAKEIIALATAALAAVETLVKYVAKLKALAATAGATDEELADVDTRLTAAIAARDAS